MPANYCRSCRHDFSSLEGFDRHRVGKHDYLYSEVPSRPDGRRCLSGDELLALGYEMDGRGRWFDPARAARTRVAFAA